jgi:hypothetical protein
MADTRTIARESFRIIETGDEELAQRIIAPNFVNAELTMIPSTSTADYAAP